MDLLLKKIESSAAARFGGTVGKQPGKDLAQYQAFLKVESHRLKMLHRAGESGLAICHGRAALLDVLLRYIWNTAIDSLGQAAPPAVALVALGGYGRAELNPHSDIDLMFLQEKELSTGKPSAALARLVDGVLYPLWDLGLKVGHSTRGIADSIRMANADMQSKTSLIEARLITGDAKVFQQFQETLLRKCVRGHEDKYIDMRLKDQEARRAKFGNSACMQEPNIKNGCGGLRDYQNLLWMAFVKYQTRTLEELQAHELINANERKQLEAAYDFLLRVRTEMHYHTDRGMDVLSKNLQPSVALNLGYRERSPSKRIEGFMRDVYSHARNIFLITRTLEQRLALLPRPRKLSLAALLPSRSRANHQLLDGFKLQDPYLVAARQDVFKEDPRRLMRVFLYAQQRRLRLHPDLIQLIRHQLPLVDRGFRGDEHVRETFLAILSQRGSVAPILRGMHEVGLLGKYMPEFGQLTCLVQHEFYHQYAADEHTLVCLEYLDRLWEAEDKRDRPSAELFHSLERPCLLYLALLLHDVGKPTGHGRHARVSADMALKLAKRLHLDAAATHGLNLVIEHHLLLARISQRRDLDDPAVIRYVARHVQTPEMLQLLTIHTYVDALATSDKLWNGFKDSLLWSLHFKAMRHMSGKPELARAEEQQKNLLGEEIRRQKPEILQADEIDGHFAALPGRYFQVHSAKEVLDDLMVAHQFMRLQIGDDTTSALAPVVHWQDDADRACNTVKVCTWDRSGLFAKIAGCFSAAGLNILSAQVFTRQDGIALDTFSVTNARSGSIAGPEQRRNFEHILSTALVSGNVDLHALMDKQRAARTAYQPYTGEQIQTNIWFDNEISDNRSLIEVETEDRVGLLYAISDTLNQLCLDVRGAKITTEKGAALDSFYVRELTGGKVEQPERQKEIEKRLIGAINKLSVNAK